MKPGYLRRRSSFYEAVEREFCISTGCMISNGDVTIFVTNSVTIVTISLRLSTRKRPNLCWRLHNINFIAQSVFKITAFFIDQSDLGILKIFLKVSEPTLFVATHVHVPISSNWAASMATEDDPFSISISISKRSDKSGRPFRRHVIIGCGDPFFDLRSFPFLGRGVSGRS